MTRSPLASLAFVLVVFLAAGCGRSRTPGVPPAADSGRPDAAAVDAPIGVDAPAVDARVPPSGDTFEFVVDLLDVAQADPAGDPNVVPGFNLDGRVSTDADPAGCFHPDFRSPPPDSETGVDNQMGPILSSVGMSLDLSGMIAEGISDGSVLLLMRVSGVDDARNDPNVTLELFTGAYVGGLPTLTTAGTLAPGQTFQVATFLGEYPGEIVGGRAAFKNTAVYFGPPLFFDVQDGEIRFDFAAAGLSVGVLGGSLDVDETVATIVALAPDDIPESLARSILEGQADLFPDATGNCQSISMGLIFAAVPAVIAP